MKIFFAILIAGLAIEIDLIAAEAGMPQLDPKYWASQAFWLIITFTSLYLIMSKLFIPKIKNGLDDRDNKIKNDLDNAKKLQDNAEIKQKEYDKIIEDAKKQVQKIIFENKNKLNDEIKNKKKLFEKEIDTEVERIQKEILTLKENSINKIEKISADLASKIIEEISGDKLNESSIKAIISETSKNNLRKYL